MWRQRPLVAAVLLVLMTSTAGPCHVIRRDSEVPCSSLGRFRTVRLQQCCRLARVQRSVVVSQLVAHPRDALTCGVVQAGIEECASRCLDESGCDYIRGEPQSSTAPGYSGCELLGCPTTLEGTGVQGDRAELRSRTCFSRTETTQADVANVSVRTAVIAFVGAVLCFSLPLCWQCARKQSRSLAAARQAIVAMDLPPLSTNQPELDHVLDEHPGTQYVVSKGHEGNACDTSAIDLDVRAAEEAQLVSCAESTKPQQAVARPEAAAELDLQRREKEEREEQLVRQKREEEERRARLRREEEEAEERRLSEERELQRAERERLARREAEKVAAMEAEQARIALENEAALKIEENRRRDEEQRAWHLEQQRLAAQEEKQQSDALAAARARQKAKKRLDKLARVSSKSAAERAASAAGDAAAERVARRAREAISAMTPSTPKPSTDDSVMMSLAAGTPLSPPPRPIAELILERHSDRRLVVCDSDDDETDSD